MDLTAAKVMADALIYKHLSSDWTFSWHNRKRSFGTCSYKTKSIMLSRTLTAVQPEEFVKDTILHEIAHALVGPGHGHDATWKAMASKLGCNPKATSKAVNVNSAEERIAIGAKWFLVDETGKIWRHWYRKPAKSTFEDMPFRYYPEAKEQTLGKLKIIPIGEYNAS